MSRVIQLNISTAKFRRIPLFIYDDTHTNTPWAGAVAGIKARLSFNGGAEANSSADIVRVAGAVHYVELTQAEANTETGLVTARVVAAAGREESREAFAEIVSYDPFQAGATVGEIADAIWDEARAGHLTAGTFGEGVPISSLPDGIITATKIAADAIGASQLAATAATEIVTAVFAKSFGANYNNYTFQQIMNIVVSVLAGVASGLNTNAASFADLAGLNTVITATVDTNGNRLVVAKNP